MRNCIFSTGQSFFFPLRIYNQHIHRNLRFEQPEIFCYNFNASGSGELGSGDSNPLPNVTEFWVGNYGRLFGFYWKFSNTLFFTTQKQGTAFAVPCNMPIGLNYLLIEDTTPEPTVLPPSRIANLKPSSIAIGVISSTSIVTLSPGIHISVPSGSLITPVTSVVLKKN